MRWRFVVAARLPARLPHASPCLSTVFGLPEEDFRCRFALSSLHLWLTLVRLRSEGDAGKLLGQARGHARAPAGSSSGK